MAAAVTASPTFKIRQDRNEKARDEKSNGKSQNKRYDPFEKSGVQHKNLTCLNNLPIIYGARPNSVSPTAVFLILTLLSAAEKFFSGHKVRVTPSVVNTSKS
jgi:hypothetical protein